MAAACATVMGRSRRAPIDFPDWRAPVPPRARPGRAPPIRTTAARRWNWPPGAMCIRDYLQSEKSFHSQSRAIPRVANCGNEQGGGTVWSHAAGCERANHMCGRAREGEIAGRRVARYAGTQHRHRHGVRGQGRVEGAAAAAAAGSNCDRLSRPYSRLRSPMSKIQAV